MHLRQDGHSREQMVCVIGADPVGLISAKHPEHPDELEFIVFEKSSDVGRLWIYTDSTTVDEHGLPVHSSMYRNLRINTPKNLVFFPDFPEFLGENRSYTTHWEVHQYPRNFTHHFNWWQYIRESKPNVPKISGIEKFSGRVLHSHLYRKAEDFTGQTVVTLGAGTSGVDISIGLNAFAKAVYLSYRHDKIVRLTAKLPENMQQVVGVIGAKGNELILSDGSKIKDDMLLLCTGYLLDFPFLGASSGITVEDGKYVRYVYKNFINIQHPTMALLNIPTPAIHTIIPGTQVQFFIDVLRGKLKLRSKQEMLKDAELPAGTPKSKAHHMLHDIFSYYDQLAATAGFQPLPYYVEPAFGQVFANRIADPGHFREQNAIVYDDGHFEFVNATSGV